MSEMAIEKMIAELNATIGPWTEKGQPELNDEQVKALDDLVNAANVLGIGIGMSCEGPDAGKYIWIPKIIFQGPTPGASYSGSFRDDQVTPVAIYPHRESK